MKKIYKPEDNFRFFFYLYIYIYIYIYILHSEVDISFLRSWRLGINLVVQFM